MSTKWWMDRFDPEYCTNAMIGWLWFIFLLLLGTAIFLSAAYGATYALWWALTRLAAYVG